jgi:hypothetical protein
MQKIAAAAAVLLALVTAGSAGAGLKVGVAEDTTGYLDGGAAIFNQMRGAGMSVVRMTVMWDETQPTTIQGQGSLAQAVNVAASHGLEVAISVAPLRGTGITGTPNGASLFANYCLLVAKAFPQVRSLIIGNEPNQPRFWQPQFDAQGHFVSGAAYEALLAKTYDLLKGYDSSLTVVGIGLSPRGGDDPHKTNHIDTSPVHFIHDLGAAYRASARSAPLMDDVAFHPYPNPNQTNDPPSRGYGWPNAGLTQLDRLQQAFWDAFNGSGQPTFAETGKTAKGGRSVKWVLDETAYQVSTAGLASYTGAEPNQMVSEDVQAKYYAQIVSMYECSPLVSTFLFFHWVDETNRQGYQSGFESALGQVRPAAATVKSAISAGCSSRQTAWTHAAGVVGAHANFSPGSGSAFTATATEHFTYSAGVYRLDGKSAKGTAVAKGGGASKAYWTLDVRLPAKRLPHGTYVYRITMRAEMNPARVSVFTSRPFAR